MRLPTLRDALLLPVVIVLQVAIKAVGVADAWQRSQEGVWDADRP